MPELPGLRAQRVGRDDPDAVAAAGEALASCYGPGVPPRFAVAAISYAVAPVIIAAMMQPGGDRIASIIGIGGYHDVVAAMTYLITGYYRSGPGQPWRYGNPEPVAKWVFVIASASHLPEPRDRALLREIADAKLVNPDADVRHLEAGLGSSGSAVMALVRNPDPERVPELVAALPELVRRDIEYLDLSHRQLRDLRANLLLIHGRDDPLIPATESLALAAAVPPGHADVFVVGNLSHVEIHPGGIPDTFLLWRAAYRLLALRNGLTVPVRPGARSRRPALRPADQDDPGNDQNNVRRAGKSGPSSGQKPSCGSIGTSRNSRLGGQRPTIMAALPRSGRSGKAAIIPPQATVFAPDIMCERRFLPWWAQPPVSTIEAATALVSCTATRSPGRRAAANPRMEGWTTTSRSRPPAS